MALKYVRHAYLHHPVVLVIRHPDPTPARHHRRYIAITLLVIRNEARLLARGITARVGTDVFFYGLITVAELFHHLRICG